MAPSLMFIDAASFASKSAVRGGAAASLWHVLQSFGAGATPESCEWQVKQVAWLGAVLNVPFFSQKRSPRSLGGSVAYSESDLPCGWRVWWQTAQLLGSLSCGLKAGRNVAVTTRAPPVSCPGAISCPTKSRCLSCGKPMWKSEAKSTARGVLSKD